MLRNKTIAVGVCGGIAAYKAVDIVSRLKKLEADVHVVMTEAACKLVAPLTFQTISQNLVIKEMFDEPRVWEVAHVSLAEKADAFLIAPATANVIGKIANGIADDFLTTTIMATKCPVVFAPSMNCNMYENPIVQGNIEKLKKLGYMFIAPEEGLLACGVTGKGRLADNEKIVEFICDLLAFEKDFLGVNVLVTAGPTHEEIDPVRFITNHSSGKMGYAIAKMAKMRGANVTLVSGPVSIDPPLGAKVINVTTAQQMYEAVISEFEKNDVIIKAAAVGDFRPVVRQEQKIKKSGEKLTLELEKNPDILAELGKRKKNQILVGFCMETENLVQNAKEKLASKNLDLIVANDLNVKGAGFATDTNAVTIIGKDFSVQRVPLSDKADIANIILDNVKRLLVI